MVQPLSLHTCIADVKVHTSLTWLQITITDVADKLCATMQVIDVSAGGYHSFARTSTGQVFAWGWNIYGQLGIDSQVRRCWGSPMQAALLR